MRQWCLRRKSVKDSEQSMHILPESAAQCAGVPPFPLACGVEASITRRENSPTFGNGRIKFKFKRAHQRNTAKHNQTSGPRKASALLDQ
jgi:hypothetical protein